MFTTLVKGYGSAVLIGILCASAFGFSFWQTAGLIWLGGAPLALLLGAVQIPTLHRPNGIDHARAARTQGAGY